ncbi:MAG: hypothetical protein AVDCRST_MAG06-822, partial [uncultured Nocardioides sp.]
SGRAGHLRPGRRAGAPRPRPRPGVGDPRAGRARRPGRHRVQGAGVGRRLHAAVGARGHAADRPGDVLLASRAGRGAGTLRGALPRGGDQPGCGRAARARLDHGLHVPGRRGRRGVPGARPRPRGQPRPAGLRAGQAAHGHRRPGPAAPVPRRRL